MPDWLDGVSGLKLAIGTVVGVGGLFTWMTLAAWRDGKR